MVQDSFSATGSRQSWSAPYALDGDELTAKLDGAGGGDGAGPGFPGSGGNGGYAEGEFNAAAGETLYIYVGTAGGTTAGGWPSGGKGGGTPDADGGGGGGHTDIRRSGDTFPGDAILVAGGGGGGGGSLDASGGDGGGGGGTQGADGADSGSGALGGAGGTQTSGNAQPDGDGAGTTASDWAGPGGGGGGYWGGDVGEYGSSDTAGGGGGGAGSGFAASGVSTTTLTQSGGASGGGSVTLVYPPAIPTNIGVTAVSSDQLDVTWDASQNAGTYHVLRAQSSGSAKSDYTEVGTVSDDGSAAYTFSDTNLEAGEKYYYRVYASDPDKESDVSGEASGVTDLPAATNLVLDTSVEDEITVDWTKADDSSDGEWEVFRSTDGSLGSKIADGLATTTTSYTDTGLNDGEKYYYTVRRITDHSTSDTQTSGTTVLPAPSIDSITSLSDGVQVKWTDNADNEDGFRVYATTTVTVGFDDVGSGVRLSDGFVQHKDLSANTTQVDLTGIDGGYLKIKVEAYTEHETAFDVDSHFHVEKQARTSSTGWHVEVEADDGSIHEPTVIGSPQRNPKLNAMPTIRIPVPRDEKWQSSEFEGATLRVWYGGVRQPIDELTDVVMRPEESVLEGWGGVELLQKISTEFDQLEVHTAAQNIIQNQTGYTANVDTPSVTQKNNQDLQSPDTTSELKDIFGSFGSNTPLQYNSGKVEMLQTCWTMDAPGDADSHDLEVNKKDNLSNGDATVHTNTGDSAKFSFTSNYDIPEGKFDVGIRYSQAGSSVPDVDIYLDGTKIVDAINTSVGPEWTYGSEWDDLSNLSVSSGSHTIEIRASSDSTDGWYADVVAPHDTRYSYNFDNTLDGNQGYLDGPELRPPSLQVVGSDATTVLSVFAGSATATMDDTSGNQSIGISNDRGDTWNTASNSTSVSATFNTRSATERFRVTLSRYGSRTGETPKTGFKTQSLDSFDLDADLDDMPLVVNRSYEGRVIDVLRQLAELGGFVFEFRRNSGTDSIEWTKPGQRSSGESPQVSNYDVTKTTSDIVEEAIVKGNPQPISGEAITANHGSWVDLSKSDLVEGQEYVYDPSTGTGYEYGTDYKVDRLGGRIQTKSSGNISDGQSLEVNYYYRPTGSYTESGVSSPEKNVFNFKQITNKRAAEVAAYRLVGELKNPQYRASVTIPTDETGWTVVEDLDPPDVPTDGNSLHIQDVTNSPAKTMLTLGNRGGMEEEIEDIKSRLSNVSRF